METSKAHQKNYFEIKDHVIYCFSIVSENSKSLLPKNVVRNNFSDRQNGSLISRVFSKKILIEVLQNFYRDAVKDFLRFLLAIGALVLGKKAEIEDTELLLTYL